MPLVLKDQNIVSNRNSCIHCRYKRLQTSSFLDCNPAVSSASHQNGSCVTDEKEKLNHYQTQVFHKKNMWPARNIGTFVIVNSSQINFLIAVVLT